MTRAYGICEKCGKYYTSWSGSVAHSLGACDKVADKKDEVLADQEDC